MSIGGGIAVAGMWMGVVGCSFVSPGHISLFVIIAGVVTVIVGEKN